MSELKPCPFCGSKNIEITGRDKCWIRCNNCGCEGPTPANLWPTDMEAIEAWNMRGAQDDPN
jgi:Lar family restriction alleviation protein